MNLETIQRKLAAFRLSAFVPQCVDGDLGPAHSKFAGVAWINAGEAWPVCEYCKKPMQLLLQLSLSELPSSVPGWPAQGFAQVFYCTTEKTYCEQRGEDAFSPFGKFLCARVLERGGSPQFTETPVENPLPARSITGWQSKDDYPAPAELGDVAPDVLSEEEADGLFDLIIQASDGDEEVEPTTLPGDKLGGWPMWLQDPHHPECPECSAPMEYVAQIRSNGNLDFNFGDCGIAHLHRCSKHPQVLGFSWAGS